jgi:hypothetical protein
MFDYETLAGLEAFREVRLEPLPVLQENEQPLFRAAYSVTQARHYCQGNHIDGIVLFVPSKEARAFRQIHLYQGHDASDGRQVAEPRVQTVALANQGTPSRFSHYAKELGSFVQFILSKVRGFKELEKSI